MEGDVAVSVRGVCAEWPPARVLRRVNVAEAYQASFGVLVAGPLDPFSRGAAGAPSVQGKEPFQPCPDACLAGQPHPD
eukprot:4871517-Lingulodinium_polyedra.AAC.1